MRGKEFLAALKIDAEGPLRELSAFRYIYVEHDQKLTNQLKLEFENDQVWLVFDPNEQLTVNQLVLFLNAHKEAFLFYGEQQPIYGYRLAAEGLILG
ncbi:hypothetical protein [Enterococcus sp. CSURQ0835]|uniref:hypothetical protein n=1 Tax=Enterococcus sp. CSURQ0835 TaxID=2681394 RepID=UPI001357585E|nr:hypothetical protein [Enterococcus sp. CSURQ0835]